MIYSICDFYVEFTPKYSRLKDRSEKYIAKDQSVKPELSLEISDEEISSYVEKYSADKDLAEYVLAGAKFYDEIIMKGAFFLHSSALCVDGYGFAFTGPCGVGKSTHASLWRKYFGSKVISINDDKPAIKIYKDMVFICGTPFSGKHDINSNVLVPLCGICILEQAKENSIIRLTASEAIGVIMSQTINPDKADKMSKLFELLDETLTKIPVYKLRCNTSFEAVELSYKTMKQAICQ